MENINLSKALDKINIKADWIGIRQVKETTSYRIIRDLKPEANNSAPNITDQGPLYQRP